MLIQNSQLVVKADKYMSGREMSAPPFDPSAVTSQFTTIIFLAVLPLFLISVLYDGIMVLKASVSFGSDGS
jgi:hypothetical protein